MKNSDVDKTEIYNHLFNFISNAYSYNSDNYQLSYRYIKDNISKLEKSISKDYYISNTELYKSFYKNTYKEYFNIIKRQLDVENDIQKEYIRTFYKLQFTLLSMDDTSMTRSINDCIKNGKLHSIPIIISQEMSKNYLEMPDISFLKVSDIVNSLNEELTIPRELRKSLKNLNLDTAMDIMRNHNIYYDLKRHCFVNKKIFIESIGIENTTDNREEIPLNSTANSKELNAICSGTEVLNRVGNDELFTENELMDFCTFLSLSPMVGFHNEVGERIWRLIETLFQNNERSINFDKDRYYHCRSHRKGEMPFTFEEMLQAPHGIPWAGRFNQVGRSCYYFSDSRYGAEVEVKSHLRREEELQTVVIRPINNAILLDLSGTLKRGERFLKYLRFKVPEDDTNKMPKQYLIPCYVADCCRNIGFNGIKYYGSKEYMNYVCWTDGHFGYVNMILPNE